MSFYENLINALSPPNEMAVDFSIMDVRQLHHLAHGDP